MKIPQSSFRTVIFFFDAVSFNAGLILKVLIDFDVILNYNFHVWQDINSMNIKSQYLQPDLKFDIACVMPLSVFRYLVSL